MQSAGSLTHAHLDAETLEVWLLNEEHKVQVTRLGFEQYWRSSDSHEREVRNSRRCKFELLKVEKVPHFDSKIKSKMEATEALEIQIVHGVARKNQFHRRTFSPFKEETASESREMESRECRNMDSR